MVKSGHLYSEVLMLDCNWSPIITGKGMSKRAITKTTKQIWAHAGRELLVADMPKESGFPQSEPVVAVMVKI